jgi:ornithine cyclodeaminase
VSEEARWISEADVVELLDLPAAIEALEDTLTMEARGDAANMVKTHVTWGANDTLHAIGAVCPTRGIAATKTWAHTGGGATPLLIVFDAGTGSLLAVIEAFALGQLRTAGISSVATAHMAERSASELAIIGTGKQALPQIAAVAAVRPIERVRVFSPNSAHRTGLAARVKEELGLDAEPAESVERAVAGAPIVTLVTRATAPFLSAEMVARGAHVNAIGAIVPQRIEFEPRLLSRCDLVAADSVHQAQELSREFIDYFGSPDDARWEAVRSLGALVADDITRPAGADVTLFKALGMGISDLALGLACLRRACGTGRGRPIVPPSRARIRWRVAASG